ncbi:MAG: hypothetical protein NC121_12275 [Blautia sp.]|nr:hypothetical protein [Blautia sp.]
MDQDEYRETITNIGRIRREALSYVEEYIAYMNDGHMLHPAEFKRRYEYSTLAYFLPELGIK